MLSQQCWGVGPDMIHQLMLLGGTFLLTLMPQVWMVSRAHSVHRRRAVPLQVLLNAMQPAYKFALVERINEEVLAAAAEGVLPLDTCGAVLSDMLRVLCVKEMAFDVKAALPVDDSDDAAGISASQTQVPSLHARRTPRLGALLACSSRRAR